MKRTAKYVAFDKKNQTAVLKEVTAKTKVTENNANVSKNRYALHDDKKSYLSHIDSVKDVHELFTLVSSATDKNVRETQYFVFISVDSKDDVRLRIQKNCIELHSNLVASDENASETIAVKDAIKYSHFVAFTDIAQLIERVKRF